MRLFKSHRIFTLSLFLALFVWLYVRLGAKMQMEIDIPLQIINVREGYGIVSDLPETVSVLFESDGKTLLGYRFLTPPRFVIDLAQYKGVSGFHLATYTKDIVYPSKRSVTVISVQSPDSIVVRSEALESKKVPVHSLVRLDYASGYIAVGGIHVRPDSVTVTYPASWRDSVMWIETESKQVDNLDADRRWAVKLMPPSVRQVRMDVKVVEVSVDVQALGEIEIDNIPVRLINVPPYVTVAVQPSTFSAKVRGGVDYLSTIPQDSILGTIDFSKEYNSIQPRLDVALPRDLTLTQITPTRFNLIRFEDETNR